MDKEELLFSRWAGLGVAAGHSICKIQEGTGWFYCSALSENKGHLLEL